jgi:hypothetical protein
MRSRWAWGSLALIAALLVVFALAFRARGSVASGAPRPMVSAIDGAASEVAMSRESPARVARRDRRAADAIRERLTTLRAQTKAAPLDAGAKSASPERGATAHEGASPSPASTPATMPPLLGPGNQASAALGKYIKDIVRAQFVPVAKDCYRELLSREPTAAGTLNLSVIVGGHPSVGGVVESVEALPDSTLHDQTFVTCMVESMMATQFAAPANDQGRVSFVYPFKLTPD